MGLGPGPVGLRFEPVLQDDQNDHVVENDVGQVIDVKEVHGFINVGNVVGDIAQAETVEDEHDANEMDLLADALGI